jgi:N-glycosidase YbiA
MAEKIVVRKNKQTTPSRVESKEKKPMKKPMNQSKEKKEIKPKRQEIRFYRQNDEYGCFSNFYPSPFSYRDFDYPTVEHFFQAMKMTTPEDVEAVRTASTPAKAKLIGRERNMRKDWEEIRFTVMLEGLKAKFSDPRNKELKLILLGTRNAYLIEDSPTDLIWGYGKDGKGQNLLGVALAQVRTWLKLNEPSLNLSLKEKQEEEEENEDVD